MRNGRSKARSRVEPIGTLQCGFRRGSYQVNFVKVFFSFTSVKWVVPNLHGLVRDELVESNIFEIAGYSW